MDSASSFRQGQPSRVLVVSNKDYSPSNRGIDLLAEAALEGAGAGGEVYHLKFPNLDNRYFDPVPGMHRITVSKPLIPYYDRIMGWFPRWMVSLIGAGLRRTARHIDFRQFDLIVLESGKSLFLTPLIPEEAPIIYRQSDSVRHILARNEAYARLEDLVIERAVRINIVKEYYREWIPVEHRSKTVLVENGFTPPSGDLMERQTPFDRNEERSFRTVIMGLAPLDYSTLRRLLSEHRDTEFHIIGTCVNWIQKQRLRRFKNSVFWGLLDRNHYLPLVLDADAAVVPTTDKIRKNKGLSSRYLLFMYLKKPIISYRVEHYDEFSGLPLRWVDTAEEMSRALGEIKAEGSGQQWVYPFPFQRYTRGEVKERLQSQVLMGWRDNGAE